jgi:hypothetical protein
MNDPVSMWEIVSTGGTLGLAVVFLYLFQSGKIRSEKQFTEAAADHTKVVEAYSKVIEHKDREIEWWREAYTQQAQRGDKQEEALRENMEMGRTMLSILEGMSRTAKRARPPQ